MQAKAPRLPLYTVQRHVRGALRLLPCAAAVWLGIVLQGQAVEQIETRDGTSVAWFDTPTDRYGHAIMGHLPEWGRLCLDTDGQVACVTLPYERVFEDMAPRLADVDLDGVPEAIVVEASFSSGAALVVYRMENGDLRRIATPHIGTRNRWLAPAAIADLDNDGFIEIAFVDRPHLARTLRVWRYKNGALHSVAALAGLTNHRIGEPFITGGFRSCETGPEIITADGAWRYVMATQLQADSLNTRDIAPFSQANVAAALNCEK